MYLSTRRGAWVLSRLADSGAPFDMMFVTRFINCIPMRLAGLVVAFKCNQRFCHATFGLKPNHPPSAQHPMVNDGLPRQIITGALIVKPNVAQFTEESVQFEDGSIVYDLDAVIFCTGYDMRFPYLEIEQEIVTNKTQVNLYKYIFPPFLKKPTLAVIGNIQPLGPVNPISELQARLACGVFAGRIQLPNEKKMNMDISIKREEMKKRYYATKRHTVQVNEFTQL